MKKTLLLASCLIGLNLVAVAGEEARSFNRSNDLSVKTEIIAEERVETNCSYVYQMLYFELDLQYRLQLQPLGIYNIQKVLYNSLLYLFLHHKQ